MVSNDLLDIKMIDGDLTWNDIIKTEELSADDLYYANMTFLSEYLVLFDDIPNRYLFKDEVLRATFFDKIENAQLKKFFTGGMLSNITRFFEKEKSRFNVTPLLQIIFKSLDATEKYKQLWNFVFKYYSNSNKNL